MLVTILAPLALGGSWLTISGVISPLIWVTSIVTLPVPPLITTHKPPQTLIDIIYPTPNVTFLTPSAVSGPRGYLWFDF